MDLADQASVSSNASNAPRAVRYMSGKMTTAVAKMADHQVIVSFNPNVSRNHMPIGRFGPRTRSSR